MCLHNNGPHYAYIYRTLFIHRTIILTVDNTGLIIGAAVGSLVFLASCAICVTCVYKVSEGQFYFQNVNYLKRQISLK